MITRILFKVVLQPSQSLTLFSTVTFSICFRVVRQSPARLSISIPDTSCDSALSDSVFSADSFVSIETSDVDTSGNSSLNSSASEDENSKPKGDNSQNGSSLYPELRRVTSRDFRPSSHYSINSQDGLSD